MPAEKNVIHKLRLLLLILLEVTHLAGWMPVVNICMLLLLVSVFLTPRVGERALKMVRNPFFYLAITPFLMYAISLLYTYDLTEGIRNVTTKLPLLLFPVNVAMISDEYRKEELWIIGRVFIWSVALMGITGFIFQYIQYLETADSGFLYNDHLGSKFGKQAVYFAWYVNSALCILLFGWKAILAHRYRLLAGSMLLLLLMTTQVLLASRTSLAIMILIIAFYGIHRIAAGFSRTRFTVAVVLVLGSLTLAVMAFPKVLNRFKNIASLSYRMDNPNPINHFNGTYSDQNWDGLTARLAIWECSRSAIGKHFFAGCGVGDVPHELRVVYREKHFILGQKEDFNTHNQFIDAWLTAGLAGFLIFTLAFVLSVIKAFRTGNTIIGFLLIILVISMLTENLLNRNQGVVMAGLLIAGIVLLAARSFHPAPDQGNL